MIGVEDDARRVAIWRLQQTLAANRLPAEVAESEPVLVVAGNPDEGTRTLTVRCYPHDGDGDRLWFWLVSEPDAPQEPHLKPLMEVVRLDDAMLRICGERRIEAAR